MKFLVIFALISLAVVCSGENELTVEKALLNGKLCKIEAGVTFEDNYASPEARSVRCMRSCIYKKCGLMNKEGRMLNDKNAKKTLTFLLNWSTIHEEVAGSMVDKCYGVVGSDDCETAYAYSTCLGNELEKMEDSSE